MACGGGQVCARNGQCYAPAVVHAVSVSWTVGGAPADTTVCNPAWHLEITFRGPDTTPFSDLSFAPVPCEEGRFTIDKLPLSYTTVTLGDARSGWRTARIDPATGAATIDLPHG